MRGGEGRDGPASGYGFLLLSALVYAVNVVDRQLLPLMAEAVRKDIGLADWQLGLLTGVTFATCYALCTVPLARIADRGHRRNLVAACLGVFSLATAACGFVQSFWQLVAARTLVAVGEAGTTPASLSMLADRFPDRRAFASAALNAGAHLGILVGVLLVSILATHVGWRPTFVATGLMGLALSLLYAGSVQEPQRRSPPHRTGYAAGLRALAGNRSFVLTTLGVTGLLFFLNATTAWIPSFLSRVHGLSTTQIGAFVGLTSGLLGLGCVLASGLLIDRLSRRDLRWLAWLPALVIVSMVATTAIGLSIDARPTALLLLAIAPAIGLVAQTCAFALLQAVVPSGRHALATAVLFLVANLIGMGCGPTVVGALSSLWAASGAMSLRPALLIGVLPSLAGAIAFLLLAQSVSDDAAASVLEPA